MDELKHHREEILASAAKHGVKNVRVFGSVARGEERPDSDIDLLINVTEDCDAFGFLHFQQDMEEIFHRKVDIVFESGLFHALRPIVMTEAKPL